MDIDWERAPEGATHWDPNDDQGTPWMKFDGGKWYAWEDGWMGPLCGGDEFLENNEGEQCIPRPVGLEYTGGSVSYYTVRIRKPTNPAADQYDAECNDIIEALQMNYAEGNAFKALWRRAAARMGKQKRGYDGGLYDAEKVQFFGGRLVEQSKQESGND